MRLMDMLKLWLNNADPTRVSSNLWVGDHDDACGAHNVFDHVVSVARDADDYPVEHYYPLKPYDEDQGDLLGSAASRTAELVEGGGSVLVHCHAGRERAPVVAAAALSMAEGGTMAARMRLIADRRDVQPPAELVSLAEDLEGVDT